MLKDKLLRNSIRILTIISIVLSIVFWKIFKSNQNTIFFALSVFFGSLGYHLANHLIVGEIINAIYKNDMDYTKKWFKPKKFENELYNKLKVKNWKDKIPSFHPDTFSLEKHSPEKIAKTMCQSEIVHEIIIVFSFLPLIYSFVYGIYPVFFILSSFLFALFDLSLVIMQRYNRPRFIKLFLKNTNIKEK